MTSADMSTPSPPGPSTAAMWRKTFLLFAVLLLATPLVAMAIGGDVAWSIGDFAIFAAMLGVLGLLLEGAARLGSTATRRALLMGGAALAFLLVWAELAVGILP